jgi:hypothetical protein
MLRAILFGTLCAMAAGCCCGPPCYGPYGCGPCGPCCGPPFVGHPYCPPCPQFQPYCQQPVISPYACAPPVSSPRICCNGPWVKYEACPPPAARPVPDPRMRSTAYSQQQPCPGGLIVELPEGQSTDNPSCVRINNRLYSPVFEDPPYPPNRPQ